MCCAYGYPTYQLRYEALQLIGHVQIMQHTTLIFNIRGTCVAIAFGYARLSGVDTGCRASVSNGGRSRIRLDIEFEYICLSFTITKCGALHNKT